MSSCELRTASFGATATRSDCSDCCSISAIGPNLPTPRGSRVMFKPTGNSRCLLPQLEVGDSPRLLGVDPIVRYFPPAMSNNEPAVADSPRRSGADVEDSDDDVCFGPITIRELRKASMLVKTKQSELPQNFLAALKAETETHEMIETSGEAAEEALPDQPVQEFSLEEANFSGCDMPSFSSDAPAPEATAAPSSDGLFTLAFISELAKKLEVTDANDVTQWHDAETETVPEPTTDKKRISDVSLLSNETELLDNSDAPSDDKNDTNELLNDTIDEMERILGLGIDYLETPQKSAEKAKKSPSPELRVFEMPALPKRLFSTPACVRTPAQNGSHSAGAKNKVDTARQVHQTTPFRPPKGEAPRSADFKLRLASAKSAVQSRLPKPVRPFSHIASPVGQYINAPNLAPKIASAKQSPRIPASAMANSQPKSAKKSDLENACPLPFVNYDTTSSIKVIESMETKKTPIPGKIKRLLPSPGSVLRHTGRVNIPETSDGRHEASIIVTHDAFLH